ncbi:MAG: iron ABC transporter permease [Burkholderiales bacterium]|nr:iron ABC transporter permease [Burkholderiales bacterium]
MSDSNQQGCATVQPKRLLFSRSSEALLPWLAVALGIALIAAPLAAMLLQSLTPADRDGAIASLANFAAIFRTRGIYDAVLNTLVIGVAVTVFSTVLGFALAWIVSRTDLPGRALFETLNLVPFFLSPYVGAISWIYLAAPYGGLIHNSLEYYFGVDVQLPTIYGLGGVIWVLTLFYAPYVYLFVIGPLRRMDGALEDAARVHGSSFLYATWHITLRLTAPALMSGALIVFVTSAGLFDVPLALSLPSGIPTVPTEIYKFVQYPTDFGRASSFGVMIVVVTVVLTLVQRRYVDRRRFDTVTGKGYRPRTIRLKGWPLAAALGLELMYVGTAIVLPLLTLVLVSLSPIWTGVFEPTRATFHNYQFVLFESVLARDAILNSLILAVGGATISVLLALFQSYYLRSGGTRRPRSIVDATLSLPLGIPPIIFGVAFLIIAVRTPLLGTLSLILIAYIARFFPYATRSISAMLLSLHRELEESARCCGASFLQSLWFVALPLLKPGLVAAWIMLAIIFVRELGATVLLYTRGTETLSVALLLMADRSTGYVAALAVIQVVLLAGGFALLRMLRVTTIET